MPSSMQQDVPDFLVLTKLSICLQVQFRSRWDWETKFRTRQQPVHTIDDRGLQAFQEVWMCMSEGEKVRVGEVDLNFEVEFSWESE